MQFRVIWELLKKQLKKLFVPDDPGQNMQIAVTSYQKHTRTSWIKSGEISFCLR